MLQRSSSIESVDLPENGRTFDLWEIVNFAWRQWKFIGSIAGLAALIAMVYLLQQAPRYTANALVLLDPQRDNSPVATTSNFALEVTDANFASQVAIIKSATFLRRVVEKERLAGNPEFSRPSSTTSPSQPIFGKIRSYIFGSSVEDSQPKPATPQNDPLSSSDMSSITALMGAMSVNRVGEGYILSIAVTSVDPVLAARLANAIADAYVVEKLDARFEAAKRASAWLSDRLVELRKQLRESEEAVAQFRVDQGLVQSGANVTLNQQQISELNAKLVQARQELSEKKSRVEILRSIIEKGGSIQSLPDLPESSVLGTLRQQEAQVSQKEADLIARYSDRHPLVVNVRAEHRDVNRAISAELQRLGDSVKNVYELARARVDTLERSLREATGQSGTDDKTAITLRELERTAAVNKSLFENFLQKAKITQEEATFEARDSRVITPAMPPDFSSYPKKFQTMIVAIVIGLMLGVGGALAREKLSSGFTTSQQIERILDLPVLASVLSVSSSEMVANGKTIPIPYCPAAIPLGRYSDAMHTLRSGIKMADVDDPPKVIQVTSTLPAEGKTTIGLSLAISAAASGQKVLFIDADLRHPSASRFFNLQKERGFVDLLLGTINAQDSIKFHEYAKLWVLPAGSKTRNPTDLLSSDRAKLLIENCKQSFDFIVIDTPPVGPVIDPVIVGQLADKIVYIIRWASTAREIVQQSLNRLRADKKIAGVVLNLVDELEARKYGKHTYGYYYGNLEDTK